MFWVTSQKVFGTHIRVFNHCLRFPHFQCLGRRQKWTIEFLPKLFFPPNLLPIIPGKAIGRLLLGRNWNVRFSRALLTSWSTVSFSRKIPHDVFRLISEQYATQKFLQTLQAHEVIRSLNMLMPCWLWTQISYRVVCLLNRYALAVMLEY